MATFLAIKNNIKQEVRYLDSTAELPDATNFNRWINKGYEDILNAIQSKNERFFLKKHTSNYTFTSSTQFQNLPSDFIKFVKLTYATSINKDDPDIPKGDATTGLEGYVLTYTQSNATTSTYQIGIIGATYQNKALSLWYNWRPSDLSADTDVPAFPSTYHDLLESAGIYRYWLYRGDMQKVALWKKDFDDGLKSMLNNLPEDNSFNGDQSVRVLSDIWSPYLL